MLLLVLLVDLILVLLLVVLHVVHGHGHECIFAHGGHFFLFGHGIAVLHHLVLHGAIIVRKAVHDARLAVVHYQFW